MSHLDEPEKPDAKGHVNASDEPDSEAPSLASSTDQPTDVVAFESSSVAAPDAAPIEDHAPLPVPDELAAAAPDAVPMEDHAPLPVPDELAAAAPLAPPAAPVDKSAFLRALGVLVTAGASLGGFVAQLTVRPQLDQLIAKNDMPSRLRVEVAMGGTGAVFLFAALIYVLLGRRTHSQAARVESLHRFAIFLLPLTLAALVPPLFRITPWSSLTLELLMVLFAFGIVLEPLARLSMSSVPAVFERIFARIEARVPDRLARWTPPIVVGVAALGYVVFASVFTIVHHIRLGTACWDLGQFDNLFYNALHGHPFRVTSVSGEADWKSLRGHAEVGLYFLLPIYAIRPGSEILLVIQSALLGSATIAVYLFGTRFVSKWAAMFIALAYVIYAPLHRSNFYEFHMQPVAAAFTLWMLYFFVAERNVLFWLSFVLALTAREDISIGLAVFGAFLMITGYRFRVGMIVTIVSVIYFVLLKGVIMPLAGGWWFADIYKLLQIPGKKGYGSIIETLVSNPVYVLTTLVTKEKLTLTLQILLPLAFLPLRRAYLAMSVIPGFFFTLLTTAYNPTVTTLFQYNGYWIAYIFPASAVALRVIGGESACPTPTPSSPAQDGLYKRRAALVTMMFLSVVTSFHFGALLQRTNFKSGFVSKLQFSITADEWKRYRDMRALADMIPQDVKLAATEHVAPHVSARVSLYCFRDSIGEGEYVIFGMQDKNDKNKKVVKDLLKTGKVGVIADRGDFVLLKKGASTERNAQIEKRF